jgi:hypothetical protein
MEFSLGPTELLCFVFAFFAFCKYTTCTTCTLYMYMYSDTVRYSDTDT